MAGGKVVGEGSLEFKMRPEDARDESNVGPFISKLNHWTGPIKDTSYQSIAIGRPSADRKKVQFSG